MRILCADSVYRSSAIIGRGLSTVLMCVAILVNHRSSAFLVGVFSPMNKKFNGKPMSKGYASSIFSISSLVSLSDRAAMLPSRCDFLRPPTIGKT
jgi:hypothetical protein